MAMMHAPVGADRDGLTALDKGQEIVNQPRAGSFQRIADVFPYLTQKRGALQEA